jgi:prolyl-tRNA editing enzyme YbaK/EbsC (Cys-tRNA(Pro) deacylase)
MATFVDPDLLEFDEVWAAAGTPNTVFAIQPPELVRITGAQVADIT